MTWFTVQFSNFRRNPMANEKEIDWSMLWLKTKILKLQSNRQSAFYASRTWQELSFHQRNFVQSSRTWQVLQQLMKFHLIFDGLKAHSEARSEAIFDNWKTFKIDEICFLFYLKSSFCSQDISVFVSTFRSCRKTAWLER